MANPFYNAPQGQIQAPQVNVNDLLAQMKKIGNPKAVEQMIQQKNPALYQVLMQIKQNPKAYVMNQAMLNNLQITPDQLNQMFNDLMSKV